MQTVITQKLSICFCFVRSEVEFLFARFVDRIAGGLERNAISSTRRVFVCELYAVEYQLLTCVCRRAGCEGAVAVSLTCTPLTQRPKCVYSYTPCTPSTYIHAYMYAHIRTNTLDMCTLTHTYATVYRASDARAFILVLQANSYSVVCVVALVGCACSIAQLNSFNCVRDRRYVVLELLVMC